MRAQDLEVETNVPGVAAIDVDIELMIMPLKRAAFGGAREPTEEEGAGVEINLDLGVVQVERELQEDAEVEVALAGTRIVDIDSEPNDNPRHSNANPEPENKHTARDHHHTVNARAGPASNNAHSSKNSDQVVAHSTSAGCNQGEIRCTRHGKCLPDTVKCCNRGESTSRYSGWDPLPPY
jgi:hypothetical protein